MPVLHVSDGRHDDDPRAQDRTGQDKTGRRQGPLVVQGGDGVGVSRRVMKRESFHLALALGGPNGR